MPLLFKERKKGKVLDMMITMMMVVVITIAPVRTGQSETTTVPTRTPLNWVKPF